MMKYLLMLAILVFSLGAQAQYTISSGPGPRNQVIGVSTIDTVLVRGLALKVDEWSWLVAESSVYDKTVRLATSRKISRKLKATPKATAETVIIIDSLPGREVINFYQAINRAPAGVIGTKYASIKKAIVAKKNLAAYIKQYDTIMSVEYRNSESRGRSVLLD